MSVRQPPSRFTLTTLVAVVALAGPQGAHGNAPAKRASSPSVPPTTARLAAPDWSCVCGAARVHLLACATLPAELMCIAGAECLRSDQRLPEAASAYTRLLQAFPATPLRRYVLGRLFEIGNYWLDDTRREMELTREWHSKGDEFYVACHALAYQCQSLLRWDRTKPMFDEAGAAVELMKTVVHYDPKGPLADKAYFLSGSVYFFTQCYRDADRCYSGLLEARPDSPLAATAAELAILSKKLSPGDPDFKHRKHAEIRELVGRIRRDYPELAEQKKDFLERMNHAGKE